MQIIAFKNFLKQLFWAFQMILSILDFSPTIFLWTLKIWNLQIMYIFRFLRDMAGEYWFTKGQKIKNMHNYA